MCMCFVEKWEKKTKLLKPTEDIRNFSRASHESLFFFNVVVVVSILPKSV